MIEKTAKKKVLFISTAVAFIAIFIGFSFIYKPFISKKVSLRTRITEERKKNLYLAQIKLLKEHVDFYEKRLLEQKNVSWLLDEISRLASENGLELLSLKPESPEDQTGFIKLPIRIEANLTYHGLSRFLSNLESSKKFIKVENLQLKRIEEVVQEGGKPESFKVRANILVSSIILKD